MKSVEVLSIVAMSLFCLLGVLLLSKNDTWQKGLGWLGIFFILLAINYLDGILLLNGFILSKPYLAFWEDPFVLLYGPLIYFFILQLKNDNVRKNPATLLHLIPFAVIELVVAIYHLSTSGEKTRALLIKILTEERDFRIFLGMIPFFAHVFFYILLAQNTLRKHQANLKQYYSTVEIRWAFALLRMILIIFSLSLLSTVVLFLSNKEIYSSALMMLILVSIFLTLKILLAAMNQPIFHAVIPHEATLSIPKEQKELLKQQIISTLKEKKLFTNPKLTLKDLAIQLKAPERAVSLVINESLANNFYDLINDYRIDEAREIFKSNTDSKLTILEVLYQVGFNSKSSFNTQFKKKTGLTPSEFRRLAEKKDNN